MAQIAFFFNQTRCTGCYTCAVACKDWYDLEAGVLDYIRVKEIEKGKYPHPYLAYMVIPCLHCGNPACAKVCPVDAISKRDTDGIVVVDQDGCIGGEECGMLCAKACPWNVPQFGRENNAKMEKCELCRDRLEEGRKPICVEACPMYALDIGPLDQLQEKYGIIAEVEGFKYHKKLKPSVIFKPKEEDL